MPGRHTPGPDYSNNRGIATQLFEGNNTITDNVIRNAGIGIGICMNNTFTVNTLANNTALI